MTHLKLFNKSLLKTDIRLIVYQFKNPIIVITYFDIQDNSVLKMPNTWLLQTYIPYIHVLNQCRDNVNLKET